MFLDWTLIRMFQLCHDHESMNSFRTCSSVTNSTTVNGPCLKIVGMKPLYKAITPYVLTVFMAHPSPIQSRQSTPITDLVKTEQQGAARFLTTGELSQGRATRVVVVYTTSRGGEVHMASRGELSLSLKPAHSPSLSKLRI